MITKENFAIILGFILGTIIAAGIIFFIVIGISMMFGVIPTQKYTVDNSSINTYDGMVLSFLFKDGTTLINETDCDLNSQQWGENCTCRTCMPWSGYDTKGFINRSGIYYSDGTLVGIPRQEVDRFVALNRTKYPFEFIIQGHNGYTYNGVQWGLNGKDIVDNEHVGPGEGLGTLMEYECLVDGKYYPSSSGKCVIDISDWEDWNNPPNITLVSGGGENTTFSNRWDNTTSFNNTLAAGWTNFTVPNNITPLSIVVFGGGGGCPATGCPEPFNITACDLESKEWGEDCTCLSCGVWIGYDTKGFYNLTGVYYDDGTSTYMTLKQMEKIEEINAKQRYSMFMAEHGVLV